ncbi:hypothetical protein L345_10512, partial [Ophiophagus hannah]
MGWNHIGNGWGRNEWLVPQVLLSEKMFHDAAKRNDTASMIKLIKRGVDVKAKNNIDRTALHWAAGAGHEQAVRLLLEHEAAVNGEDSVLVNAGAKANCVNKNGHNLLHCAAQRGHLRVMKFIVEDLEDVWLDKKDKGLCRPESTLNTFSKFQKAPSDQKDRLP